MYDVILYQLLHGGREAPVQRSRNSEQPVFGNREDHPSKLGG